MTARWVVDEVVPERDLTITWEPISLLFKNEPEEGSQYHSFSAFTHGLLRVLESVKEAEGQEAVQKLYWEYGAVLHHDRMAGTLDPEAMMPKEATPFLEAVGLDVAHNEAFSDDKWDQIIRERMTAGLDLVGEDVGTPIIAFDTAKGLRGVFGPVISRIPPKEESLALWDAMATISTMDGFWELKRTRTEDPILPDRP